mgnify:FL=1
MCTHRRVTPALGARLLRSYVPLRYGPSESGCDNNTCLPADTLLVRKIRISPGLDILSVRGYNELTVINFFRAESEGEIEYEEYL